MEYFLPYFFLRRLLSIIASTIPQECPKMSCSSDHQSCARIAGNITPLTQHWKPHFKLPDRRGLWQNLKLSSLGCLQEKSNISAQSPQSTSRDCGFLWWKPAAEKWGLCPQKTWQVSNLGWIPVQWWSHLCDTAEATSRARRPIPMHGGWHSFENFRQHNAYYENFKIFKKNGNIYVCAFNNYVSKGNVIILNSNYLLIRGCRSVKLKSKLVYKNQKPSNLP